MDISIVLEWENAILSELDRTSQLLVQIFKQTSTRNESFELLVLHNENQVSGVFIKDFIDRCVSENSLEVNLPIHIVDVQEAHYFQLKNQGVKLAKGEKIIFFDSDIVPEENWMEVILEVHSKFPKSIISGYSYIDFSDWIGKAFSLSWFFPLPPEDSKLEKVELVFSNNYIAPRKVLLENPYPEMKEGVTRGADVILWERLIKKGVELYKHSGARASHPAPNGLNHFFKRALAEGRDDYQRLYEPEFAVNHPFSRFTKIYLFRSRKALKSPFVNGKRVNLKSYEIPIAAGTMVFYYQLYFFGGLTAKLFPSLAKSSWRI
ncbi:glycosyl transferase family 2 [Algoriphagus boseongensis]|uniref:Glycosyl transferase family 2 n=1 Tax=Algoriphagus boseongensis TaxID=1442587 RepID=A0A4R6T3Y4_9BACT|nr:glycosyltransferase family A protein [Algoriphagus boseongensis]TDQ16452.1 glycosyl transferase family 2 [Algoriphagus boseongensis]